MSMSFDVYRVGLSGERVLVHSTPSAREAREVRDAGHGTMLVVGREGELEDNQLDRLIGDEEGASQPKMIPGAG